MPAGLFAPRPIAPICRAPFPLFLLLKEENLDHADAGCFWLAADLRGVLPRRDGYYHRRFPGIARLKPRSFNLRLLIAFPIVILPHDRTILVSQLKSRVRQRVGDPKRTQGRTYGKDHGSDRT